MDWSHMRAAVTDDGRRNRMRACHRKSERSRSCGDGVHEMVPHWQSNLPLLSQIEAGKAAGAAMVVGPSVRIDLE
jgi:hypothetical protein